MWTCRTEPDPEMIAGTTALESLEAGSKLQTYAWLIGSAVLMSILKDQIFYLVCWSSSRALYKSAFEAVLRAPMRFFDENSNGRLKSCLFFIHSQCVQTNTDCIPLFDPEGRILNRFSSDAGTMDEAVPISLYYTVFVSKLGPQFTHKVSCSPHVLTSRLFSTSWPHSSS